MNHTGEFSHHHLQAEDITNTVSMWMIIWQAQKIWIDYMQEHHLVHQCTVPWTTQALASPLNMKGEGGKNKDLQGGRQKTAEMSKKGSNHSNCEDWRRLCRHGGSCVWLWRGKIYIFWKRMVQVRKMEACLENTDYSSCLKLTVTRGVLGKELGTMNWS